jgi:hypothetical protein
MILMILMILIIDPNILMILMILERASLESQESIHDSNDFRLILELILDSMFEF